MVDNVIDGGSENPIEYIGRMGRHDDEIGLCFGGNGQDRIGGAAGTDMNKRRR